MIARAALLILIVWCLALPLRDVLAYPDRVSVLPNLQADAAAYDALAHDLARTWRLEALPTKHPPGWIAMLAVVYALPGGSYVKGKLLSWMALVAIVAGSAWLARHVYGPLAAWICALLTASSPALRGYVGTLQYEVVTGALLVAMLLTASSTINAPDHATMLRRAVYTGVWGAVLVLTRETFPIVVVLIGVWLAMRIRSRSVRDGVAAGVIAIAVAATPAIVWSAVQSFAAGRMVLIADKGPITIALGFNPLANGTYNEPLVGVGQPTGVAFVREHPHRAIVLAIRKVLYFWGVLRDGWNVPRPAAVWLWRATTGLVPLHVTGAIARGGWLLAAFLVSLWWLGRRGWQRWWILPASVIAILAIHVLTLASHRFAVPILPVVFILISGPIAAAAARAWLRLRVPSMAGAVVLLAAVVVVLQFQRWPLTEHMNAADMEGVAADNTYDAIAGSLVRAADARRGSRPIILLPDEYLPAGPMQIEVHARRTSQSETLQQPAARMALIALDGQPVCARDIMAGEMPMDRYTTISMPCPLEEDRTVTFAFFARGSADLAVESVRMIW